MTIKRDLPIRLVSDVLRGDTPRVALPKVSIIVVNYNGLDHIEDCLSSLSSQTYPNYETVLVDNDSNDGSPELALSICRSLKLVRTETNLGYAGGVNAALPHVSSDYVVVQNMDTVVEPEWLACMMEVMLGCPKAGAVAPRILLHSDPTRLNSLGINIHVSGLGFNRGYGHPNPEDSLAPHRVDGLHGASFVIRRDLLDRLGGMNDQTFMYYDDVDLSWLVNLAGFQIICAPSAVVYHKYELKMNPLKFYYLERNRWFLLLSALSRTGFLLCLPALMATEAFIWVYAVARGWKYVRAKVQAVANLWELRTAIARRRVLLQGVRKVPDWRLLLGFKKNYAWDQLLHIVLPRGQGKRSEHL